MRSYSRLAYLGPIFLASAALAQNAPAPAPANTAPPTGGGNRNIPVTTTPTNPNRMPTIDNNRPVFISGRVLLEDGSPPADRAKIERVCFTTPIVEGYTDNKGYFNLQLGRKLGVFQDASTSPDITSSTMNQGGGMGNLGGFDSFNSGSNGGLSERDLASCEIRANLPGYAGESIPLAGRHVLDNPDIGVIVMRSLAGVTGFTFSATTGLAPKDAKKAFEKGSGQFAKNKLPEAQKELEKAVGIYPKFAAAWSKLGNVYLAQQNPDQALEAFNKSIAADDKFVDPYVGMLPIHAQKGDWAELSRVSEKVIRLNAVQYPQAYYMSAVASFNLKKYEEAEKTAREAIRLDSAHRFPRVEYLLGVLLASKNENSESVQFLRSFVSHSQGQDQESAKKLLVEVEKRIAP